MQDGLLTLFKFRTNVVKQKKKKKKKEDTEKTDRWKETYETTKAEYSHGNDKWKHFAYTKACTHRASQRRV